MMQVKRAWHHVRAAIVPASALVLLYLATGCIQSTGTACTSVQDCILGDTCLTESEGFPGGYCTTEDCDISGCPDLGAECFDFEVDGRNRTICLANCDAQGACSRQEYGCFEVTGSPVCLPTDGIGSNFPAAGSVGSACSGEGQCSNGLECLTHLDGGYCSASCSGDSDCPTSSHCEQFGDQGFCYRDCTDNTQCRAGYVCTDADLSEASCVPSEGRVTVNPNGVNDGQPCVSDINCKGGVCSKAGEGYPGGYCTTLSCGDDSECNGGVCITNTTNNVCKAACSDASDCRDGYRCVNGTYCQPEDTGGNNTPITGGGGDAGPIEIQCGSSSNVSFSVPAGAIGFYIAPFTSDGSSIDPTRLRGPNGIDLDLKNEYDFYSLNPQLLVSIAPLLFPGSDMPALEGERTDWSGQFTLENDTRADEVCYYIIPKMAPGRTIDVNFYLVGVQGVTTANADSNSDFSAMLAAMRKIYGKANINLGAVRWMSLSDQDTSRYSIIRDFTDVFRLVALSRDPGPSTDERLSVNVFLIRDFDIPEIPGTLLGISPGLPGIAGFHGTEGAGLIFSSVNLRGGGSDLGQTMAHEIGHFLGLRHSSEHGGGGDPISDTPECSDPEKSTACPDHKNFMFPFAIPNVAQENVSSGQGYVLQRSALVK